MSEQISNIGKSNEKINNQIDLNELLGVFKDNKCKITIITLFFTFISTLYALIATPIYRSTALIQIEQSAGSSVLSKLSEIMPDSKPESQTEIGLIKSRMVLGQTVDDLGLDTIVYKKHLPLIGKGVARILDRHDGKIAISRLSVPETLQDLPLTLTVTSPSSYNLVIDDRILSGKVGELLITNEMSLLVSEIDASVGTTFIVTKLDKLTAIDNVLENFSVTDLSKDSGMLQLSFKDEDAKRATRILNSISNNYLQQDVARKSEEAAKSLEFLKKQLPSIRRKLDDLDPPFPDSFCILS